MTIDKSVGEFLRDESAKMAPAMYYQPETDTVTVESQLSPHDGQLLIAALDESGHPLEIYAGATEDDLVYGLAEIVRESLAV